MCVYIYIDDVRTHVNVNVCTLPLASNAKAPNYTARTRTARTFGGELGVSRGHLEGF